MIQHLAEVHIADTLEHYADLLIHHATMMHCDLDNSTLLLSQAKALLETQLTIGDSENAEDELDGLHDILDDIDNAISQTRSGKIVCGKILAQIEDLRSRRIVLNQSTLPSVEHCAQSVVDLSGLVDHVMRPVFVNSTERQDGTMTSTHSILTELRDGAKPLPTIPSHARVTATLLQGFHSLSTSIAQTVEFVPTSVQSPWKTMASQIQAATADLHAREHEISRLKDVVNEKDTRLALKEKSAEELAVKLEVFERRIGESGEHRDKIRTLESSVEKSQRSERESSDKLTRLHKEYRVLQNEREQLKVVISDLERQAKAGPVPVTKSTTVAVDSEASLRRIQVLQAEIEILQSSIRYISSMAHQKRLTEHADFLSEPVIPKVRPASRLASESQDILREMLGHITQSDRRVVAVQPRPRGDRFRWQPAKDTIQWQHQNQREEWTAGQEWRNDIAIRKTRAGRSLPEDGETQCFISTKGLGPSEHSHILTTAKPALTEGVRIIGNEP